MYINQSPHKSLSQGGSIGRFHCIIFVFLVYYEHWEVIHAVVKIVDHYC
jgi:hypothetical protein